MKKLLTVFVLALATSKLFAVNYVSFTTPIPQYGCPYATNQSVTIGVKNISGINIPSTISFSVLLVIMDQSNTNTLGGSATVPQTITGGLANGATKYVTISNVNFAGAMACNVTGSVSFTYGTFFTYPISTVYNVQYPPDITITENPVGTIALSTTLVGYSVNYYLNASTTVNNSTTAAATYTPTTGGSYTAKAANDTTGCISVNVSNAIVIKDVQTITFPTLSPVTIATADFAPGATSTNSGIAITYTTSDAAVATIVAGNIHVVGAGTVTITAHQVGDATHYAAADAPQTLTVNAISTAVNAALATSITVYPNPASDIIFVGLDNTTASEAELTLTDIMGLEISKVRFSKQGNSLGAELSVSQLAEGIYFLHIQSDTGVACKKITKK